MIYYYYNFESKKIIVNLDDSIHIIDKYNDFITYYLKDGGQIEWTKGGIAWKDMNIAKQKAIKKLLTKIDELDQTKLKIFEQVNKIKDYEK